MAETQPASAAPATSTATAAEVAAFGLSDEAKDPDPLESVTVVVTRVGANAYGKMIIGTSNDQVWRQTDQGRPRMPDVPFEAEIRSGASGSFFIRPLSGGRSVRVRRDR